MRRRAVSRAAAAGLLLLAAPASPASRRRAPPAPAQLLWPLDFDDGLSAAFGELRGDRLHAGIDLRTRGETGQPVRAVGRGAVVRLKEEWRGYGLALYLRLDDGRIAVYGHLERVAPDLERRLAAARRARGGRWAGDVEVDPPRRAARGEAIAWSGESGAGLPHLHLEIRQGMDRPLNPFLAGLAAPGDPTPPVAEELIVVPAAPGALVNGRPAAAVFPLARRGEVFAPEGPIATRGPVRLLLRAHDRSGSESRAALGALRTAIDGREVYDLRLDAIAYADNHTAGVVFDLARSHLSPTFYTYRLTGFEGAELPFARGGGGALDLAPGPHVVEAWLSDAVTPAGARARLRFELEAGAALEAAAEAPPVPGAARTTIAPAGASTLVLGGFRLEVGPGAAWAPATIEASAAAPPFPEGLVPLAPPVRLEPDGHPLRQPAAIGFEGEGGARAGVYRLDATSGAWLLEDLGRGARIRRLGVYALLEDQAPPRLEDLEVARGSLRVQVSDLGSGIPERGVEVRVDGVKVEELYDPDRGRVTAPLRLAPGAHEFHLRATDRAGNYNVLEARRTLR